MSNSNGGNSTIRNHSGWEVLDQQDIRLGSFPLQWQNNDIPEPPGTFVYHETVVIPSENTTDYRLVVLGGRHYGRSVRSIQLGLCPPKMPSLWQSLPDMNTARDDFGAVCLRGCLYSIGGDGTGDTFEILNLNDVRSGWTQRDMPSSLTAQRYCKAATVDDRYIYLLSCSTDMTLFGAYDTHSHTWDTTLTSCRRRGYGFSMVSIAVPGEGSYVLVLGGTNYNGEPTQCCEAYHVKTQTWLPLPDLPETNSHSSMASFIGNRYILVAGGRHSRGMVTPSVIAFDWKKKRWFEFPSLPEVRAVGSSAFIPDPVNKWVVTGGYSEDCDLSIEFVTSLQIAPGIGWAKEKLLLLCFRGKAQKRKHHPPESDEDDKPCHLEGLDSGIFSNILQYLITPFSHEIECKGSILASTIDPPNAKRMQVSVSNCDNAKKKSRTI